MVYTRSGKSTSAGIVTLSSLPCSLDRTTTSVCSPVSSQPLRRKRKAPSSPVAMDIFLEDATERTTATSCKQANITSKCTASNDENAVPLHNSTQKNDTGINESMGKTAKRSRGLAASSVNTLNTVVSVTTQPDLTKKVSLSVEEKAMNGAPEGDLYDVVLLEDDALPGFASLEAAREELQRQLALFSSMTVWAEKYETVTLLRRVLRHHYAFVEEQETLLQQMVQCVLDQIASLRSTNVRNALLCLKQLTHACSTKLWNNKKRVSDIFTALLLKSGSGPKFLCDAAYEASQAAAATCLPALLVDALQPLVTHKNLEVSSKSIFLVAQSVLRCERDTLRQWHDTTATEHKNGVFTLKAMLCVLAAALSAKKAEAKEKSREALLHVRQAAGDDLFNLFVSQQVPSTAAGEIQREFSKSSSLSSANSEISSARSVPVPLAKCVASLVPGTRPAAPKPWASASSKSGKSSVPSSAVAKPWAKPASTSAHLPEATAVSSAAAVATAAVPATVIKKPWERPLGVNNPVVSAPIVDSSKQHSSTALFAKETTLPDLPSLDILDGLDELM